jgi:hypothetical protein
MIRCCILRLNEKKNGKTGEKGTSSESSIFNYINMSVQSLPAGESLDPTFVPFESDSARLYKHQDPEEDTSTVCTPSTPALSRITRSEPQSGSKDPRTDLMKGIRPQGGACGWYFSSVSPLLARGIEDVIRLLWGRDDMTDVSPCTPYTTEYLGVRRCSLKYINTYMSSLITIPDDCWAIVLAGIFLAFKSADFIPGKGRVRMNQLLEAFSLVTMSLNIDDNLINDICKIEMKMMCQSNFRFD